ncbi:tetratricopeptide repeat protein [uncultured Aquimarina sp.]|uniref:tetratricopeptide repeat protein n=1 Tax=uncultured Aquimarina sp. TaxID=575652 RepID=UPI0026092F20|nr:tetratricopeptide repeat protein [uncultured Aquimarina sp.]
MENVFFERGSQLFQIGKFDKALQSLQEGLQSDPDNYWAKSLLVRCYLELDDFDKGEKLNELLISQYPNEDELFYNKAVITWHQEKKEQALQAINEAISLDPYNPDYFGYKGLMLLESKDYSKSLDCANEGLALHPNNVLCLNVRAQILVKLNRKEEAQETVENTLHQDPEGSFSHASIGWVHLEQGDHKKAMHHFKESLKNDPNSRYAKDGMLESIKAKNFVYRLFLKYAFWVSNMKEGNQWAFIIGLYIAYRVVVFLLSKTEYPYVAYFVIVPYLLFALGGWIIGPLSNAILLLNPNGKYLLETKDRVSGILFAILSGLSVISFLIFFISKDEYWFLFGISSVCSVIPISMSALIEKKSSRYISYLIGFAILFSGTVGSLFTESITVPMMISIFGLVGYSWIGNFLKK